MKKLLLKIQNYIKEVCIIKHPYIYKFVAFIFLKLLRPKSAQRFLGHSY